MTWDNPNMDGLEAKLLRVIVASSVNATDRSTILHRLAADADAEAYCEDGVACCVCGADIDTREESQGGSPGATQVGDGRWVCSQECWDIGGNPI